MNFGYTYALISIHTSFNLLTHKPKQILEFSLSLRPTILHTQLLALPLQ